MSVTINILKAYGDYSFGSQDLPGGKWYLVLNT